MSNYIIRKAEKKDMSQVLELIKELAAFEREPDAVEVTVLELEKEGFGKEPFFTCFVAEMQGEIVGMALIYYRFSTWKGRSIHLEDLIVKDHLRNLGIGKALYTQVLKYAQEKNVRRVEWVVLNWNTNAINFYEKTGAKVLKDWYIAQIENKSIAEFLERSDE